MKFREMITSSGTKILMGKNAEQNEELVKKFMGAKNIILHTANPGSPFCVIDNLKPNKKEVKEAAVVCARYSQDWRDNKKNVIVHKFTGKDTYKEKNMKIGTFGVKKPKKIKARKGDIEKLTR
jgi:predicted ribosome quality control (RQC) complex YloA/Tae2 family protein